MHKDAVARTNQRKEAQCEEHGRAKMEEREDA